MSSYDWPPSASHEVIRTRASLLANIREFFASRGVLEVDTPVCSQFGTTDPSIESLKTRYQGPGVPKGQVMYLQTSPEFPMKRLLAAELGSIYQICKAFRQGESGRRHNPEFSLLEWYRMGFDHHQLMDDVEDLIRCVLPISGQSARLTYQAAFECYLGLDPHSASIVELQACVKQQGLHCDSLELESKDAWLDLLMSHSIEPAFPTDQMTFIYDYPASQSSLAKVRAGDPAVAERFELYYGGMELANGFHELTDADEQRQRFELDITQRKLLHVDEVVKDEFLLQALASGMPDCAGVALGIDRLLMLITGVDHIDQVLTFPLSRA